MAEEYFPLTLVPRGGAHFVKIEGVDMELASEAFADVIQGAYPLSYTPQLRLKKDGEIILTKLFTMKIGTRKIRHEGRMPLSDAVYYTKAANQYLCRRG